MVHHPKPAHPVHPVHPAHPLPKQPEQTPAVPPLPPPPPPPPPPPFHAVFSSNTGVGGYTFEGGPTSPDWGLAFDGASTGHLDHLLFYNSGSGQCAVVNPLPGGEGMQSVYYTPNGGIGGFDFTFVYDKAFAFDFDHSGKMDHLFCYRPGAGGVFILKHTKPGVFKPVYSMPGAARATAKGGSGIGGWDLRYSWDLCFAFDYDHKRKMDAICIYRRRKRAFCIIKHEGKKFVTVYKDMKHGIGGFSMGSESDYAWAYDYEHTGRQDHILFVRHGALLARIVAHQAGNKFTTIFTAGEFRLGGAGPAVKGMFRGDNLLQPLSPFVFDYDRVKKNTHLVMFLPRKGMCYIVTSDPHHKKFNAVYTRTEKDQQAGSFGFKSVNDRAFAMDFTGSGCLDHIVAYTRGSGSIQILTRDDPPPQEPAEQTGTPGTLPQDAPPNTQTPESVTAPPGPSLPLPTQQDLNEWNQQRWDQDAVNPPDDASPEWEPVFQSDPGDELGRNEEHPNIGHNGWPPVESSPEEHISGDFIPPEHAESDDEKLTNAEEQDQEELIHGEERLRRS